MTVRARKGPFQDVSAYEHVTAGFSHDVRKGGSHTAHALPRHAE
jgi:hypothetical protein